MQLESARLDLGHTVNFGRPRLPGSNCNYGLISLPYLDGPGLEWFLENQRKTRCLWLIPITAGEASFAKHHGLASLENQFEQGNFNYMDAMRPSVVY